MAPVINKAGVGLIADSIESLKLCHQTRPLQLLEVILVVVRASKYVAVVGRLGLRVFKISPETNQGMDSSLVTRIDDRVSAVFFPRGRTMDGIVEGVIQETGYPRVVHFCNGGKYVVVGMLDTKML